MTEQLIHVERSCHLCTALDPLAPIRVAEYHVDEYRSAQRELLKWHIVRTLPGFDLDNPACGICLETLERQMQAMQLAAEHDDLVYVDPMLGGVPILSTPTRMDASPDYTGRGVTIAFVDSGFYPHPDLFRPANRILAMYDAVTGRTVRSIRSQTRRNPGIEDWHGTMTACVAAGNGFLSDGFYRGLASDAGVVLIRAMTADFSVGTPQVVRALRWIRRNHERYGIRVVNLSVGVDEQAHSLNHPVIRLVEELTDLGIVIVAASGNNPFHPVVPPGAAPSAITVGGYNDNNTNKSERHRLWHYSSGTTPNGLLKPELLAPAIWVAAPVLPNTQVRVESGVLFRLAETNDRQLMKLIPKLAHQTPIGSYLLEAKKPVYARSIVLRRIADEKLISPDYKHVDGTSFAAPIVSSIVAQMLEARPQLTPAQIRQILTDTAIRFPNFPAHLQGSGVVQAGLALEMTLRHSFQML